MKTGFIKIFLMLTSCWMLSWGCTSLDEEVLDEVLEGSGTADVISGSIAPAYGNIAKGVWRHTRNFALQEIASEEAILPNRGGKDWFDGGKYFELHRHTTTPTNAAVTETWDQTTITISRTLSAIEVLRPLSESGDEEATGALYEMIALRAYLNMLMLDNWGLIFKKESSQETSTILRGQPAIDYIQEELESVVDVINMDKGPGRMTQGAVWGLLARLHLNAAVWRDPYGTPDFRAEDMDKVIEYSDNIINSGRYNLSSEYFDLFDDDNNGNSELIFALDQRGQLSSEHSRWTYWSMSAAVYGRPEWIATGNPDGTNGPAMTPSFYQKWEDAYSPADPAVDARFYKQNLMVPANLQDLNGLSPKGGADLNQFFCVPLSEFEIDRGILRGTIWGARRFADRSQGYLSCDGNGVRVYPVIPRNSVVNDEGTVFNPDDSAVYVTHTQRVDLEGPHASHNSGYRFSKYAFSSTSANANSFSSIDIVLLRLGEVYLNRAEAKLRKGDNAGALADINLLRASRNARPSQIPPALNGIDLESLLDERGFELYWEGLRRTDQIRFGSYEDSWTEKTDSNPERRLFPIPQSAIDGSSNLPDFLIQNRGY
ncbi:MAG: RagB/SusD family nutrient uptake outer membrane protein [Bacteroidota bacterium]